MANDEQQDQIQQNAETTTTVATTSGSSTGNTELIISNKAYLKVVMHGLRYPHATVNGVLVGKRPVKGAKGQTIVDAIPLFHSGHGLTPMVEVALTQVSRVVYRFRSSVINYSFSPLDIRLSQQIDRSINLWILSNQWKLSWISQPDAANVCGEDCRKNLWEQSRFSSVHDQ